MQVTSSAEAVIGEDRVQHEWGLEEWLLLAGVLINSLVALTAGHFPYHDANNHLARYVLIDRTWSATPVPWVSVHLVPTPYIALDLVGVALVHLLGPDGALRVLALLPLIALPAGMYALLRVTAPSQRGWSLVGVLFSFSWWYLAGSLNFTLGLGLLCLALAVWWPRRDLAKPGSLSLLALVGTGVLAVHLFAGLMLLVVVWLDVLLEAWRHRRDWTVRRALTSARPLTAIAVTAGVAGLWLWMELATAGARVESPAFEWRAALSQLKNLASPFLVFSLPQLAIIAGGFAVALGGLIAGSRGARGLDAFTLSAAAFIVLYLISPRTWNIDLRWLPPAYLLPFCRPSSGAPPSRKLLAVVFGFCVAHALTVGWYAGAIRGRLTDFDTALERLPRTARVLPFVADQREFRVRPYYHYALWHTIRTSSQVGGLFSRDGVREGEGTYTHLSHFRIHPVPYFPLYDWGTTVFDPLDCRRIARDYDYIVQAGVNPVVRELIERCGVETFTVGDITAYRVITNSR